MKKKAFTLAEMMIVLLILSIVLAAFAPIMTRRSKSTVSKDSPWLFASNNVDAYYSKGNGRAMIGQTSANQDDDARLILEKGDTLKNIMLFKQNGNALARLYIDSNNMYFGAVPASLNGTRNVGIGAGALANVNESTFWNTSKYDKGSNTAIGYNAGNALDDGGGNTFIGANAGIATVAGNDGFHTFTSAIANTFVGAGAGFRNTAGKNNTYMGEEAGYYHTTGSDNTFIGMGAGTNVASRAATGSNNISIGSLSCRNLEAGSNKTCIGSNTNVVNNNSDNEIILGTSDTTVYIRGKLVVGAPTSGTDWGWNTGKAGLTVYDRSILNGYVTGSGTKKIEYSYGDAYAKNSEVSDIRLKNVKGENKSGLEKIKQLKVFNYTLKDDKKKTPRVGVIAQDLQKIFPDAVTKDEKGYLLIRMEDMFYALVNAVKELDAKVDSALSQGKILKQVQNDMAVKDAKIKALEAKNKELEKRIQKLEAKLK